MNEIILRPHMVHSGSLILVNNINPMYTEYASACELTLFNGENSEILLEKEASSSLSRLIHDIGGQEEITAVSGYRTQNEQRAIYSDSLKDNGPDFTRKYVALPNHSEHQTGLAVDLGLQKENIDFIRPDFPDEGICARFKAQAPSGGFIQRYKKGKENITGIADEPWHFRYLGCPHAELTECWHMALEEYIEEIKKYTQDNPLRFKGTDLKETEIFFLPQKGSSQTLRLPENIPYRISGNNIDGFIITLWR